MNRLGCNLYGERAQKQEQRQRIKKSAKVRRKSRRPEMAQEADGGVGLTGLKK